MPFNGRIDNVDHCPGDFGSHAVALDKGDRGVVAGMELPAGECCLVAQWSIFFMV